MGRALRQWLDSHGLFAIAAAVLGVVFTLSALIVLAFFLIASPTGGS
jgi:hypothetical protein